MTSAAKLFDNRRYRFDRNPSQLIDSSDPFSQHNRRHNYRRQRHDLPHGCNPNLRRTNQLGRSSLPERESHRLDQGSSSGAGQALSGNVNIENLNRILGDRFSGNDRLPGAVLLARERLLERLRGVSLLGHRQISRASTSTPNNLHDNLRDSEDLGPLAVVSSSTSSYFLIDPYLRLHESRNRPPGLNQDALDCLRVEVFSNTEICCDGAMSRASEECSICLESFLDGIELICLPCKHRFHSSCLNPWVRTCGDCPYCRTGIIVDR